MVDAPHGLKNPCPACVARVAREDFAKIAPATVLALLDRIAALEAQVADLDAPIVNARLALEKIKVLVKGEQDADEEEEFIIDIIEDWLTRYPQGAARVK